jgi:hypothetical protein
VFPAPVSRSRLSTRHAGYNGASREVRLSSSRYSSPLEEQSVQGQTLLRKTGSKNLQPSTYQVLVPRRWRCHVGYKTDNLGQLQAAVPSRRYKNMPNMPLVLDLRQDPQMDNCIHLSRFSRPLIQMHLPHCTHAGTLDHLTMPVGPKIP